MPATAPPPADRLLTGEDLARLPDGERFELVEGCLVTMSPTSWHHGRYVRRITNLLSAFVDAHDLGDVLVGEVGVYVGRDPDTVRAPDVLFISTERLARVRSESYLDVAPELVVEVVSPGNTWQELREKTAEYLAAGVERVWIVEPTRQTVLVYAEPDTPTALKRGDTLRGEGALDGLALDVAALFAD